MSFADHTTDAPCAHPFHSTGMDDHAEILAAASTTPAEFYDECELAFGPVGQPPTDNEWSQMEAHFQRFHEVDAALAELLDADRARLARVA